MKYCRSNIMGSAAHILLLLVFSGTPFPASGRTNEKLPRYFDTTNDVTLLTTPKVIYDGFTKDLTLTCNFAKGAQSDFSTLHALILSKSDSSSPNKYRELATLTPKSIGVEKKDSLGAEVTGVLAANKESFIAYKWVWPDQTAGGTFFCEAHGWDSDDHPRMSTASLEVIIKQTLDKGVLPQRLQELETNLDNCRIMLKYADASLTSWRGHSYYLSRPMHLSPLEAKDVCQELGGYLVEINDEDEYDFVFHLTDQMIKDGADTYVVAVGSWDKHHEGKWTFMTSEKPMTVFHWASGQPDNKGSNEHCMQIYFGSTRKMNDASCTFSGHKTQFICEFSDIDMLKTIFN